jgi:hypothetical protein|tara:strand:+ start:25241 stop:25408 length:168 start_codon:yes stop_codon:yes gene_type:complete
MLGALRTTTKDRAKGTCDEDDARDDARDVDAASAPRRRSMRDDIAGVASPQPRTP